MQFRNVLLREDSRNRRTTVADGLNVLEQDTSFGAGDTARLVIHGMELPDKRTVWLVALVFQDGCSDTRAIVPLRTAAAVSAIDENASKTTVPIELLAGAMVDYSGVVATTDGLRLRAVEFEPATLPNSLTELDEKIIHVTLKKIPGAEQRCYHDLREDLPPSMREGIPPLVMLDFSTLPARDGQSALPVPFLKEIQGQYEKAYPGERSPSGQAIANALAKCGMRLPRSRRR